MLLIPFKNDLDELVNCTNPPQRVRSLMNIGRRKFVSSRMITNQFNIKRTKSKNANSRN